MINIANIKSVFRLHGRHWISPCVLDSSVHLDVTIAIVVLSIEKRGERKTQC